jgi:hypothetical protein
MRKPFFLIALLALAGCGAKAPTDAATPAPTIAAEPAADLSGWPEGVRSYYAGAHLDAADDPSADAEEQYFQPPMPAETEAGDAITLTGSNIGVRMRVTVSGAHPVRVKGKPFTAVDVRLENTGITIYEGELRQAQMTFGDGKTRRVAAAGAGCSNGLNRHLYIDVSDSRRGCLLFAADGDPTRLQLALETVPAEAGGIWDLTRG